MWCTGFVLDLSTKGGFSTQWVANYLKLPLRLERNFPYHKLGVGGELCTFFFSSPSLATSPATCHLHAALEQAPQLLCSAGPSSSLQHPRDSPEGQWRDSQTWTCSQHFPRVEEAPAATALAGKPPWAWGELPMFFILCFLAFLAALRFFFSRH